MIRIIVDENIPIPPQFNTAAVEIRSFAGRNLTAEDLIEVDALLVRSVTSVDRPLLNASAVQFVASATAGIDHLDIDYLDSEEIVWTYAPGSNAPSVVDYVLGSLAALDFDPRGRRVGIVGCGQVGKRLYQRMRKLGAVCRCYDPFLNEKDQENLLSLDAVINSEILCLHVPLTRGGAYPSENMLNFERLKKLPKNAILINAGRGGVVNEADLKRLIKLRPDLHLVFDVWLNEPNIDVELANLCQLATPHVAGYSARAKIRGSEMVFTALFNHFGLMTTEISEAQCRPIPLSSDEGWRQALLEVYDPRNDDELLRSSVAESGQGFDLSRKNYPWRREISEYSTGSTELLAFGFSKLMAD